MTAYHRGADNAWVGLVATGRTEMPGIAVRVPLRIGTLFLENEYHADALGTAELGYLDSSATVFLDLFR